MEKNKTILILMSIVVLSTVLYNVEISNADAAFDIDSISSKLKEMVYPLTTTKAGNDFEDLQPLKEILKDVNILGMGEATHGTKEFFEMKHRMFEFLVEEMDYKAFAIEAEFGCHKIINDYILHGEGDIEKVIKSMKFWTWSTQEVADMINWMKNYNQNPNNKEKIRFYGFDMQGIDNSLQNLIKYLEKVDDSSELISKSIYFAAPDENKSTIVPLLEQTENSFKENREEYILKSSVEEYELILQDLNTINQNIKYSDSVPAQFSIDSQVSSESFSTMFNARDYYMAENVKWIHDYEIKNYDNHKIMLWAHNGHISNHFPYYLCMGELLKNNFKNEYYSLGFDFYKGSFVAYGQARSDMRLGIIDIGEPKRDIFSSYFKETGYPISFLDFKTASADSNIKAWLSSEQLMYTIGDSLHEGYEFANTIPIESYDGIIYVEDTNAAESIYVNVLSSVRPVPTSLGKKSNVQKSTEEENPASETEASTAVEEASSSSFNPIIIVVTLFILILGFYIIKRNKNKNEDNNFPQ
ncbi:MAG: erythromycin esterase family protein [Gottschalkiaceae bacterium]|nr:MAG: erythromycin esterase family protein [Gottschalkiaceae bacterium]